MTLKAMFRKIYLRAVGPCPRILQLHVLPAATRRELVVAQRERRQATAVHRKTVSAIMAISPLGENTKAPA